MSAFPHGSVPEMFSQSLNALMIVSYFKKLPLCDNHGRGLVSRQ